MTRVRARQFVATAASLVDVTGWYTILVFSLCAAVAAVIGASLVRFGSRGAFDLPLAAAGTAVWVVLALSANNPNGRTLEARYAIALAATGALGAALTLIASRRGGLRAA
jgi:nitric oxide reductase large subunit